MEIVALAGGIGAGKFLRGLVRVVPSGSVTAVVNTGDDVTMHGLRICPDLDSVTYWLGDAFDRDRGWGRRDETFRATEELRAFGAPDAWFGLGDLDLATHLFRSPLLAAGSPLSDVTARIAARFGIGARLLPMTDDAVTTRISVVEAGVETELHFQEYWVARRARDEVKTFRFEGASRARPAPDVLASIGRADAVMICPSNPVVSVGPILAVPGIREAVAARRDRVVGVSPIVGGAPLAGMADKLMPVAGLEVTALGAARAYDGLLGAWVVDRADDGLVGSIARTLGVRAAATDTIMRDDDTSGSLARFALELLDA